MVCGWTIHRSVPGHKQVISFRQRIESSGLLALRASWRTWRRGGGPASLGEKESSKLSTGVGHLLQIALRSQSRFAPSHKQIHLGSCDYVSDVPQPDAETGIPGRPVGHFENGSPSVPLRAIVGGGRGIPGASLFRFSGRGLPIEITCRRTSEFDSSGPVSVCASSFCSAHEKRATSPNAAHQRDTDKPSTWINPAPEP